MTQVPQSAAHPAWTEEATKDDQATTLRQRLTSRMMKLLSRRGNREERRTKSWPGSITPAPSPETTISRRQSSASITITSSAGSSTATTLPSHRPRARRVRDHCDADAGDGASPSDASWRQRQMHCVNCEQLFFALMSVLSSSAGRFCSLDCKTNFEYVSQLQKALSEQDFVCTGTSSSSSSWVYEEGNVVKAVDSEGNLFRL